MYNIYVTQRCTINCLQTHKKKFHSFIHVYVIYFFTSSFIRISYSLFLWSLRDQMFTWLCGVRVFCCLSFKPLVIYSRFTCEIVSHFYLFLNIFLFLFVCIRICVCASFVLPYICVMWSVHVSKVFLRNSEFNFVKGKLFKELRMGCLFKTNN